MTPSDIDEYISGFPAATRKLLRRVRAAIRQAAPGAAETIKYGIPTFTLDGNLISFAGYKRHIGLYPAPRGGAAFRAELAPYRSEKSTVRFALDQPIPLDLVRQIVRLRIEELRARAQARAKKRPSR